MFMGSFVWRVGKELEMPIGGMILPNLHVACFKRNNDQTMIAILHIFSSCGWCHLENLSFWRRNFMAELFGGVTWAIIGGHVISTQDQQQPHTDHKWREKPLEWKNLISPCSPNTLHTLWVKDYFNELPIMDHFIWMIAWVWESLIGHEIPRYACCCGGFNTRVYDSHELKECGILSKLLVTGSMWGKLKSIKLK